MSSGYSATATGNKSLEELSLLDLFRIPPGRLSDDEVRPEVEPKELASLKKAISQRPAPIPWLEAERQVSEVLQETLNTSLLQVVCSAWKTYQALMDDAERSRKSPDSSIMFPMKEHEIQSSLHPYIEVYFGPKKFSEIHFTVTLSTHLRGVLLGLRGGSIVSLSLGDCQWTGDIKLADWSLVHRPLAKLIFPGRIELKRGIPLSTGN